MARRRILLAQEYYLHEVHLGVARFAREAGWILDSVGYHSFVLPTDYPGDGMVIHVHSQAFADVVTTFPGAVVDVSGSRPASPRWGVVLTDGWAIGVMAAEHFLGKGYRRMAYVGAQDTASVGLRVEAFLTTASHGGAAAEVVSTRNVRGRWGAMDRMLGAWLETVEAPVALLAENDELGSILVHAALDAGRAVPDEVGVLGTGNQLLARDLCRVPLSSVDSRAEEKGYRAAALVQSMLDGTAAPPEPVLIAPAGVVERASTQALGEVHPAVRQAMAFLREHLRTPIGVADVARATSVSRRRLQDLFRRATGRTVRQELERLRVQEACRIMRETDAKLLAVAFESGFGNLVALDRAFRRTLGCTPSVWRRDQPA